MTLSAENLKYRDDATGRNHQWVTVAALGFIAYYFVVMWHELCGHGLTAYWLGARHMILTSTSLDPDPGNHLPQLADGTTGARFFYVAGSLANVGLGLLLFPLLRLAIRREWNVTLRLFLWLIVADTAFIAFIYPVYSGVFGIGDFADAILGLPNQLLPRSIESIVGLLVCYGIVRLLAASFGTFPESHLRLTLVPYGASTLMFCLAGLRLPHAAHLMLVSVIPASLLGQAILPLSFVMARRTRTCPSLPGVVPLSLPAILVAVVFAAIIFMTAPGVSFTLP